MKSRIHALKQFRTNREQEISEVQNLLGTLLNLKLYCYTQFIHDLYASLNHHNLFC